MNRPGIPGAVQRALFVTSCVFKEWRAGFDIFLARGAGVPVTGWVRFEGRLADFTPRRRLRGYSQGALPPRTQCFQGALLPRMPVGGVAGESLAARVPGYRLSLIVPG